jgi:hypothetical protein
MASLSLQQSQRQLHGTITSAASCLARQRAIAAVKLALQRQGLKPRYIARREIITLANEYAEAHRAELIDEAKPIIEQWRVEGFFGKRAARTGHSLYQSATTPLCSGEVSQ